MFQSNAWYVNIDNQSFGPYSYAQLSALVQRNRINSQTLVHLQGTQDWVPAQSVNGLFPSQAVEVVRDRPQPSPERRVANRPSQASPNRSTTRQRLGFKRSYLSVLSKLLYALALVVIAGTLISSIIGIAMTTSMLQSMEEMNQPGGSLETVQSLTAMHALTMILVYAMGLVQAALVVAIAVVTYRIWRESKSQRDSKEAIAIIALAATGIFVSAIALLFPFLSHSGLLPIQSVASALFTAVLIPLAILVERWQTIRGRTIVSNVRWVAGGLAIGAIASSFPIMMLFVMGGLISAACYVGACCLLASACAGLAK